MSMIGTLGKIAMGIMVAKGVGSAMSGGAGSGLGGLLGSLAGGGSSSSNKQGGGIGDLIGSLTGGAGGSQSGGLGDLLGSLTGGANNSQQGGGLGSLLNSLAGGSQNSASAAPTANNSNNLGDLLSSAFTGNEVKAEPDQEKQAEVILKAMISAAKADGHIDADEQKKITEHIGDITPEEIEFVRKEMQAPLDIEALVKSVPSGMEQQVYMMSLLAINLDSKPEAEYMDKLGKGLNISPEMANNIHQQLGVPVLYS